MDISPDEFRRGPKNPPFAFFLIQDGRHHVAPFSKKQGYTIIPQFCSFAVSIPEIQDGRHIDILSMLSDLSKKTKI